METVMITTTLNKMNQTQHLSGKILTGVYDDGELEALLAETVNGAQQVVRDTQFLSPELLGQILAGEFGLQNANGKGDDAESRFR